MANFNSFEKIVRLNDRHFALNYHVFFHNDFSIIFKYDTVNRLYNHDQYFKYYPRFIKFFGNANNDEVIEYEIYPEGNMLLLNYHLEELYERFINLNSTYKKQLSDMVLIPGVYPCGNLIITRKKHLINREDCRYTKKYYDIYDDGKSIDQDSLKYVYYLTYIPQIKQQTVLREDDTLSESILIKDDTNMINFDALSEDRARIVNDCFSKLMVNEYINTDVKKRKLLLGKL